jgi:hypothetical protein
VGSEERGAVVVGGGHGGVGRQGGGRIEIWVATGRGGGRNAGEGGGAARLTSADATAGREAGRKGEREDREHDTRHDSGWSESGRQVCALAEGGAVAVYECGDGEGDRISSGSGRDVQVRRPTKWEMIKGKGQTSS